MRTSTETEFVKELRLYFNLSSNIIDDAFAIKARESCSFLHALIELDCISKNDLLLFTANFFEIEFISNLTEVKAYEKCLQVVSPKIATHYKILPLSIENNTIKIAISDPLNFNVLDDVRSILIMPPVFVLAKESDLLEGLNTFYGVGAGTIDKLRDDDVVKQAIVSEVEQIDVNLSDSSMISFVNQILYDAHKARATDIHIEPFEDDISIRYRVDGCLQDVKLPSHMKTFQSSLTTRIKIISKLDISEHRLPQDGRIKIATKDVSLDLRVSIVPTSFGESINIRLLSSTALLQLDELGFSKENLAIIKNGIQKSHGNIFITGPTGSGKTTTLYSCLSQINSKDKKIITLEDPIEYQLKGITQIQIYPKIGLTFSSGLRSILRHDPDVILVGEVRDKETADIAIRSSLTGHLVFSTLHTNDAPSAITRLMDMGIEPYLIASSLDFVVAQRLIRVLCSSCKEEIELDEESSRRLNVEYTPEIKIFREVGCKLCSGTGYRGRRAIIEVMPINEEIKALIHAQVSHADLKKAALANGMKTLLDDACSKVLDGVTSIDELLRVT